MCRNCWTCRLTAHALPGITLAARYSLSCPVAPPKESRSSQRKGKPTLSVVLAAFAAVLTVIPRFKKLLIGSAISNRDAAWPALLAAFEIRSRERYVW